MKIGVVCYPTFGGSGIVATELGMEMAKLGNQVHFMSYDQPTRLNVLMKNITFHQVIIEDYPLFDYQPYSLALSSLIVEIVRSYGLDLLHVHYAIPHAYAAFIAKQILLQENIKLPVITTLHGTDITLVGQHPSYKPAVEFSINQSDYVTAVSESLKRDTFSFFAIKKEIQVIPNFIDTRFFETKEADDCSRSNFAQEDEKLLIHVSNFRPIKNIPDVINVFYRVQKKVKAKLLLIGEGPEKDYAKMMLEDLGIKDKVQFIGKVRELYEILCVGDLFLLPSSKESFGLAALEAMAAGMPVISSNAGGISEVNVEGVTGFCAAIGDTKTMAKHACELLLDEEKLNRFKNNAKNRAEEFNIPNILPLYIELYKKAINH